MEKLKEINLIDLYPQKKIDKWLKNYLILNDIEVQKWIINKANKYKRNGKPIEKFNVLSYLKPLQDYCDYYKVENTTELFKESLDDRNIRLINYLTELLNKGVNEVSVKNAYQSRIKSFFSARGFGLTDGLETEQSGLNKNEIYLDQMMFKRIYDRIENKEYKLIMMIQALTGLRISDVLTELTKEVNGKAKYKIKKYEIKENDIVKDYYYYIKDFNTQKESVKINFMFFPKELVELIKSVYPIDDLTELDLSKDFLKTRNKTFIDKYDFLKKLKRISKDLFPNSVVRTHSFRKFFSNQLGKVNLTKLDDKIGTDIEVNFKEHLLGHKVHYSSKVYKQYTENINKYFSLWKLMETVLCIDYKIKNVTDEKIVEIREENQSLKNQIEILIKKNNGIVSIVKSLSQLIIENEANITPKLPKIDFTDKDKEFQEKEMRKFRERGEKIQEIEEALKKLT